MILCGLLLIIMPVLRWLTLNGFFGYGRVAQKIIVAAAWVKHISSWNILMFVLAETIFLFVFGMIFMK